MGGSLCDQLFPEPMQRLLWKHRHKIDSILVLPTEPFIPWELVHLKEPGKKLPKKACFLGQMGLVRWLYNAEWPPETLTVRAGKARYVIRVTRTPITS